MYDKIFIRPDWDQEGPNFFIPRPEGANDIIIQVISVANKRPEYLVILALKVAFAPGQALKSLFLLPFTAWQL